MDQRLRQFLLDGTHAGMPYRICLPRDAMRGAAGSHLGHLAGHSIEFKDYRDYQAGDDLRGVDWNVFARSDKLIVKVHREEVSPHVDIVIDRSRSMDLPESGKAHAALGLAAALAVAAGNGKCVHAAWLAGTRITDVPNGHAAPPHWENVSFDEACSPAPSFAMRPSWQRHGVRVFISDLLWPDDPMQVLFPLAEGAAAVCIIQLLAAADARPVLEGNMRLDDIETGVRRDVRVDDAGIQRYRDALTAHQQQWQRACRRVGAALVTVIAEELVAGWDLSCLQSLHLLAVA